MEKGLDVDWAKTRPGINNYNPLVVSAFKQKGLSHVRIRVKDKANEALLKHLDKVIDDCLKQSLVPIIAYQGDNFKNKPTAEDIA
jgi:hypothetical protein